jgi:AraC-like DNA-binding protein
MIINAFIIDLDYKHVWWVHFFSAIAIVYLGIKAYFTDFENLHNETFDLDATDQSIVQVENLVSYDREKRLIERELIEHTAYMNNELTLKDLAKATHLSLHQVSETINRGYKMNFNELINRYRIDEVKKRLIDPQYDHLSLVAIAFDCGFNSKATFNRVFKTITGVSPSDFKASLKK